MIENVRSWLNGSRDYFKGVAILRHAQDGNSDNDEDLMSILEKGPNEFRVRRLREELTDLFEKLKSNDNIPPVADTVRSIPVDKTVQRTEPKHKEDPRTASPDNGDDGTGHPIANEPLYTACKSEADTEYKKVMNNRAVLFSLANVDDYTDPNMPDKVKAREKMALDVVTGFQKISELYDKAAFVKVNGRLPYDGVEDENDFESLPDHLVKLQLDNARKAYNKLKTKEQTADRIALMQKHQENIKKLEEKWQSLKPV